MITEENKIIQMQGLQVLQSNLDNTLQIIDNEVMKGYICNLSEMPILEYDEKTYSELDEMQFFKINQLVYQEDEFSPFKLASVFNALSNKPCMLALMIHSDGNKNNFYLGVRSLDSKFSTGTMRSMLEGMLTGQFPGTTTERYDRDSMNDDLELLKINAISSVSGVADFKQDEENLTDKNYIQSMDKFINSMQGKSFTAVFLARNINHDELLEIRTEYENIYTQISPFANMQYNFSVSTGHSDSVSDSFSSSESKSKSETSGKNSSHSTSENDTLTRGTADSISDTKGSNDSLSKGKTNSTSHSDSVSDSDTDSKSYSHTNSRGSSVEFLGLGANAGSSDTFSSSHSHTHGVSYSDSVSKAISDTLTHGTSASHTNTHTDNESTAHSSGITDSIGVMQSITETLGNSTSSTKTNGLTDTTGNSNGITLNAKNMKLENIMKKLTKQLERIDECESLGMWDFSAYFLGESTAECETAAFAYQSVIMGKDSGIETKAVNTWLDEKQVKSITPYIKNFLNPVFIYNGFSYDGERNVPIAPTSRVSTNELGIHMGLPKHSVNGLPVIEHAPFAQEVIAKNDKKARKIHLGKIVNLGLETETNVELDLDSLTMHTFLTGSTGSGKSNAVYNLIDEIGLYNIPYLVIEPAKGEYKKVFPKTPCYGTNPNLGKLLKLNPFSFPKEIHVLEHIDRLIEIFNVCWSMYAAMPAVLKDSVESAYKAAGWNLETSENCISEKLFPTFDDVAENLKRIIDNSDYDSENKGAYKGSLLTRIKSLTNGINGQIFTSDEMNLGLLFDKKAIVDISRVGSMETKSLIMGIIVLKLQEYRTANANEMNSCLKHITILEEAHNLLKKTSTEQSQDSANLQGKSVEMLTNTIAEIRTYGEGFVIVDQAPDLLDTAAIRNTNTKIVLRLPEGRDREITGKSMALNDNQIKELSKLPTGTAAIYQNNWQEAVLCQIQKYNYKSVLSKPQISERKTSSKEKTNKILHSLLKKDLSDKEKYSLIEDIIHSGVSARICKDLILNLDNINLRYEWAVADFINSEYNFDDIFKGTTDLSVNSLEMMKNVMLENIKDEFSDFNQEEIQKILYFICRVEQEKYPDNQNIDNLRLSLRKEIF